MRKIYIGDISTGSLMPSESRVVAKFLLENRNELEWVDAIKVENILQKKSPVTAMSQANLIRKRLETLDRQALIWAAEETGEIHLQILFVAAIRQSRLLGDFMIDVYQRQYRALEKTLNLNSWDSFLHECQQRDPSVVSWSLSTRSKLLQVIVRILAEARFLSSTKELKLMPHAIHPQIFQALKSSQDNYVLSAMEMNR